MKFTFRRSIFIKFVLSFILVGVLPLGGLGYLFLNAFSMQSEHYNDNNLEQMTVYVAKTTDGILTNYNTLSKMMYYENWYESLRKASSTDETSAIDNLLISILYSDSYIENVYFISQTRDQINVKSRKAKAFDESKFPLEAIQTKLMANMDQLSLFATHQETYFNRSDIQVMSFARNLLDTSTLFKGKPTVIGTLVFDVNITVFDHIFSQIVMGNDDEINVIDQERMVYYSNYPDRIGTTLIVENIEKIKEQMGKTVKKDIPSANLILLGSFTKTNFFNVFTQFKSVAIATTVVCILLLIVLSLVLSRKFSQPIREVIRQMSKMESGNLDVQLMVKSEDELGQLIRGMNRMAVRLNEFIQVAYVAGIKQEQAELKALKSQIRPHYLYNTLEVIRMSAVSNDDGPVAEMILSLSNQLEYVLDSRENVVELKNEIQNVNDYFNLIQVRYEDWIELLIKIDPNVSLDWGILKLSLQPLIENAVEHGILPKDSKGKIVLEITSEEGGTLLIRVIDDGIGMSETRCQELNTILNGQSPHQGDNKLGLKNVHDRVRSLFGESYGLLINSIPSMGTIVQITIPIIREVGNHNAESINGR
ncbi:cache domain-containing sensor histidine kinase [Paenibacillus sp. FA6]|uniref:cache domain-containing sensor histidine kinase n=1 Tax=Paenibacillus sp. FA6 TaxID=3413029 RepID=UPI003F65D597